MNDPVLAPAQLVATVLMLPTEFPDDLRPHAFKDWWGRRRDVLVDAVLMLEGNRDPRLAPAWARDRASLLAHNIALAGWMARERQK